MIAKITKAYIATYPDNQQVTAHVIWEDQRGKPGQTSGPYDSTHMEALLARARREGLTVEWEVW